MCPTGGIEFAKIRHSRPVPIWTETPAVLRVHPIEPSAPQSSIPPRKHARPTIHPSAWKWNSRKFTVANGSSTYRQAPDYGLCYPLFVVKTLRLGTIRCTVVYQGVATRNSATTREMLAQQGSQ